MGRAVVNPAIPDIVPHSTTTDEDDDYVEMCVQCQCVLPLSELAAHKSHLLSR